MVIFCNIISWIYLEVFSYSLNLLLLKITLNHRRGRIKVKTVFESFFKYVITKKIVQRYHLLVKTIKAKMLIVIVEEMKTCFMY